MNELHDSGDVYSCLNLATSIEWLKGDTITVENLCKMMKPVPWGASPSVVCTANLENSEG